MDDFFLNTVGAWLIGFFQSNPAFATLLLFLGTVRLCIKPIMTLLQLYVKWTPYDNDDRWLTSVEESKGYKLALYLLDWLLSIKGPEKK